MMLELKENRGYYLLLMIFGGYMLILNLNTPKMLDDYWYSWFFPGPIPGEREPIGSLSQFFSSWYNHYFILNGRIANFTASFFCVYLTKWFFDICNAFITVLFVDTCISFFSRRTIPTLIITIAFVLFVIPIPSQTMLWLDGSCNYLWSTTIMLCFIKYFIFQEKRNLLIAFPIALLAGAMQEGISIAVFPAICTYILINRHKLRFYHYTIFGTFLLGFLFCCLSPGILNRASGGTGNGVNIVSSGFSVSKTLIFCYNFVKYVTPMAGLIVSFAYIVRKKKQLLKEQEMIFFIVCLLTNALFLIKLGMYYPRMFFFISVFGYIVTMKYVWPLLIKQEKSMRIISGVIIVLSLVKSVTVFSSTKENIVLHEKAVAELSSSETKECVLPCKRIPFGRNDYSDRFVHWLYKPDKFNYNNANLAKEYHKKSVQFVPESVFQCYQSDNFLRNTSSLELESDNKRISGKVYLINDESLVIPIPQEFEPVSNTEDGFYIMKESETEGLESRIKGLLGIKSSKLEFYFYYLQHKGKLYLIAPYVDNFNSINLHYTAVCGEVDLTLKHK